MAYITIKANTDEGHIMLQERLAPSDMQSERLEIEGGSVPLQHPVGDEHQPVTGLQR